MTSNPDVDAFAVDGTATTRRVVPTTGLLRELDPALSQAVIAHERSHLQHHHLLYRLAVETAVGVNPLLRPVRRTIDEALEAWADDDAAHPTGRVTVATLHVARPGESLVDAARSVQVGRRRPSSHRFTFAVREGLRLFPP